MAECQNFFVHLSPPRCQSGSSSDQSPPVLRNDYVDHGLELRLGPSVDANSPKQHEMVRPIPLYPSLDRQRSGNLTQMMENALLFRGLSDVAMADKALFSKDSAFTTPPRISREQVWQTLQKTKDVFCREDVCATTAFGDEGASSVWGRRATSMQIMMPSGEMSEVDACPIRRSCSNGVPLSRQSSLTQEALVDESPEPTSLSLYSQQHEALELLKRREIQAHRRLEARKRRRLLLEVKQQRKVRQNSGTISRHCVAQQEKAPLAHARSVDHNWVLHQHAMTHDESFCVKPDVSDGMKGGSNRIDAHREEVSPGKRGMLRKPFDDKCNDITLGNSDKMLMDKECDSNSSGSKLIQGDLTDVQNLVASQGSSLRPVHVMNQAGQGADMVEGVKCTPSSCSETESMDKKGRNPRQERDSSERDSLSQKSSTEDHLDRSGLENVPISKPMLYPRGLPRTTSGIPETQTNRARFPSATQCTPMASVSNDGLQKWHTTSYACKPSNVVDNTVSTGFVIKRSVGVFSEGKWKTSDENSAFLPIRRTTSNIIEASTDPQCSAKQPEACMSGAASQLKFARMGLENIVDATIKNRTDAFCENPPFTNRLYLQNISVKKECDSYSEEEKALNSLGLAQDKPQDVFGSGMSNTKVKQEEDDMTSFNSHFASKHQEPNTFNMHSGVIDRQRSLSFLDLPSVTTTGRGPNGKTINGVMYITSARAVWLVCRCHGKHMSPTEFVEHSGSTDLSNPLRNIVVNPSSFFNQLATTPV